MEFFRWLYLNWVFLWANGSTLVQQSASSIPGQFLKVVQTFSDWKTLGKESDSRHFGFTGNRLDAERWRFNFLILKHRLESIYKTVALPHHLSGIRIRRVAKVFFHHTLIAATFGPRFLYMSSLCKSSVKKNNLSNCDGCHTIIW